MRILSSLALLLALFPGALSLRAADTHRVPVLLELFTSEGCSSCPPADRLLAELDRRQPVGGADLIVLSEHVDYWDGLGWKDPSSSKLYTNRQQDYVNQLKLDDAYTPQLVVNGQFAFVGSREAEALSAARKASQQPKVAIQFSRVAVADGAVSAHIEVPAWAGMPVAKTPSALYVVLADSKMTTEVAKGENAGRSLEHVAVARVFKRVTAVDFKQSVSADVKLEIPQGVGKNGLRLVAFVQDPTSGRILGAAGQTL